METAKQYFMALGKVSFPGKTEYSKMVNDTIVKKETIEEIKQQQAAEAVNRRWFG